MACIPRQTGMLTFILDVADVNVSAIEAKLQAHAPSGGAVLVNSIYPPLEIRITRT